MYLNSALKIHRYKDIDLFTCCLDCLSELVVTLIVWQ